MTHDHAALSVVSGSWSVSFADSRSFGFNVGVTVIFILLCSLAVPVVCSFLRATTLCGKCTQRVITARDETMQA